MHPIAKLLCVLTLMLTGVFAFLTAAERDAARAREYQTKQYDVWTKVTGNPNKLTFEEYLIWKNL